MRRCKKRLALYAAANERQMSAKRAQIRAKKKKKTANERKLEKRTALMPEMKRSKVAASNGKQHPEQKKHVAQICATLEVPGSVGTLNPKP